ncbi:MAG: hypothetical protein MI923_16280 [Phycisphaerales bacterium]|nr:hypothetical protein [Phycisphaerales bacterium]
MISRLHRLVEAEARQRGSLQESRRIWMRKCFELMDKKDSQGRSLNNHRRFGLAVLHEAFNGGFDLGVNADTEIVEAAAPHVSSEFNILTQGIVQREMMADHDETAHHIGDELVDPFPSSQPEETMSGLQAMEGGEDIADADEIPNAKFLGEKSTRAPEPTLHGLKIGLHINTVKYDRTQQFVKKVAKVSVKIKTERELRRLRGLADNLKNKRYYPYKKTSGGHGQTDVYRDTAGKQWYNRHITRIVNPLVNDDSVLQKVHDNFTARKNEANENIFVAPRTFVFSESQRSLAHKVFNFTGFRLGDANQSLTGLLTPADIIGVQPRLLFTPLLDQVTDAPGTWFAGNPKAALKEQVIWDLTVQRAGESHSELFNRNLLGLWKAFFQANVSWESDDEMLECKAA